MFVFQVKAPRSDIQKRKVVKLKKILMECLLEKNILETPSLHVSVKKPANQYLRFGK